MQLDARGAQIKFRDGSRVLSRFVVGADGARSRVAADLGLADLTDTRAAAWGDFDADGHLDLQ